MTTNLLILAGGASSRMKKSVAVAGLSHDEVNKANTVSKALIRFGKENRPILDFLLFNAEKAGYKQIYLIVGAQHEAFEQFYGTAKANNPFRSMKLSYAIQHIPEGREKPFGTADAVAQTLEQYPELQKGTFSVCNCDNLYSIKALKAMATYPAGNAFIAYDREGLKFPNDRISRFALAVLDEENNLTDIIEKPSTDSVDSYRDTDGKIRVSMNLFTFNGASMFPYLRDCQPHPLRNEKELPTAIVNFCKDHPGQFKGVPMCEHVPDLTSKVDILMVKKYIDTHFNRDH